MRPGKRMTAGTGCDATVRSKSAVSAAKPVATNGCVSTAVLRPERHRRRQNPDRRNSQKATHD
jgi:hypothetical protein